MDITTFSRQVQKMEAKKLVNRRASPDDRRVSLLDLTPAGVEVISSIDNYITERTAGIFERMSRFEQETVARALEFLNDSMTTTGKSDRNQDINFVCSK